MLVFHIRVKKNSVFVLSQIYVANLNEDGKGGNYF